MTHHHHQQLPPCPHCGATPFVLGNEGIQARCEKCNGLITVSEDILAQIQKVTERKSAAESKDKQDD